jgi:hypothetical protein
MKELDNIEQVFCEFFHGQLCQFSIYYFCNYKFNPTWEEFIYNTKQKYGHGKESSISHEIEWNDGKTTLFIEEKYEPSSIVPGITNHYYIVTFLDNELSRQISKRQQELSPRF